MKSPLIVFMGYVGRDQPLKVGGRIKLDNGYGEIRSIIDVHIDLAGRVAVVGKYRPIEEEFGDD